MWFRVALLILIIASSVVAEPELNMELVNSLSPQAKEQAIQLFSRIKAVRLVAKEKESKRQLSPINYIGVTLKHVYGKGGALLQKPEKDPVFEAEKLKILKELEPKIVENVQQLPELMNQALSTPRKEVPNCKENSKSSFKFNFPPLGETENLMVFTQKGLLPENESEQEDLIGKNVAIFEFTSVEAGHIHELLEIMGVECLPTRIQVSTKGAQRLTGKKAVMNYEQNVDGVMTKTMKKRWNKFFGGTENINNLIASMGNSR
jgi:hypothetical protein